MNIPLGLLVIIILLLYAASEKKSRDAPRLDWLSVIFLIFGLGSFVFALNQIEVWGIADPALWGFGAGGLSSLLLFAYRDRRQSFQVLPRNIIKNMSFMSTVASTFIMAYCFSLVLVMMGLYLQNTLRLSKNEAGFYFLAMTLAVGVLSPLGGRLADYMSIHIPVAASYVLSILALFILSFLSPNSSTFMICGGLLTAGLGLGVGVPSLNTAMFRTLSASEINTGSGIFMMSMTLGNAVSIIASTSLLVMFGRLKLIDLMGEAGSSITLEEQHTLIRIIGKADHTPEQLKQFPHDQISGLLGLIDQSFLYGFRITFWMGIVLSIIGAGIFLKYYRCSKTNAQMAGSQ